jgi:hypothetical protein
MHCGSHGCNGKETKVNPLSDNAPYFIILSCLTPDKFTRQGESAATQWVKHEMKSIIETKGRCHLPKFLPYKLGSASLTSERVTPKLLLTKRAGTSAVIKFAFSFYVKKTK